MTYTRTTRGSEAFRAGIQQYDFAQTGQIDVAIANHKVEGDHRGWSAVWRNGPEGFGEELRAVAGPWIQYRLALGACSSGCTPRVEAVHVECPDA